MELTQKPLAREIAKIIPLFIPEVSIESQRSSGYNDTLAAVDEFTDNGIDAGATTIRIYYLPRREGGRLVSHDIVVLDNGSGMNAEELQRALAFGGGNRFDRQGIGRFAYGLPNAAISQGRKLEVYSWTQPNEVYKATLDVEAVKTGKQKGIEEPELQDIPSTLKRELLQPVGDFPDVAEQRANLLTPANWPEHGTLVYVSDCDHLTWKSTKPFVEHSWTIGRIYRYQIWLKDLRVFVNNRLIQSVDPLYLNPKARHFGASPYGEEMRVPIPLWDPALSDVKSEKQEVPTLDVVVRFSRLPTAWMGDERAVNQNQRKIYAHTRMSVLRAERELELAFMKLLGHKDEDPDNWWGGEIHIPPQLDEAFGVTNNKQEIHPKQYVRDRLEKYLWPTILELRKTIQKERKEERQKRAGGEPTFMEKRAAEAERLLASASARVVPSDPTYQQQVQNEMLRFAKAHLRDGESPEEALKRIQQSPYVLEYEYHPEGPFYRVETFGRVIVLFLNRAHKFFDKVWEPLGREADDEQKMSASRDMGDSSGAQAAIAMLLFSIARVETELSVREGGEEWFQDMRNAWSSTLRTFLGTLK
jgi:hypothetical protein